MPERETRESGTPRPAWIWPRRGSTGPRIAPRLPSNARSSFRETARRGWCGGSQRERGGQGQGRRQVQPQVRQSWQDRRAANIRRASLTRSIRRGLATRLESRLILSSSGDPRDATLRTEVAVSDLILAIRKSSGSKG